MAAKNKGNGAREKVIDYFNANPREGRIDRFADHFLAWLYTEGYIIAPIPCDKPARRGRPKNPPVYTGPAMIGKTHLARIVNGN